MDKMASRSPCCDLVAIDPVRLGYVALQSPLFSWLFADVFDRRGPVCAFG